MMKKVKIARYFHSLMSHVIAITENRVRWGGTKGGGVREGWRGGGVEGWRGGGVRRWGR